MRHGWKQDEKSWFLEYKDKRFLVEDAGDGTYLWKLTIFSPEEGKYGKNAKTIRFPSMERAMIFAEESCSIINNKLRYLILAGWITLFVGLLFKPAFVGISYLCVSYAIVCYLLVTSKVESARSHPAGRLLDCVLLWIFSPVVLLFLSWYYQKRL
jgi:hypothetical protein